MKLTIDARRKYTRHKTLGFLWDKITHFFNDWFLMGFEHLLMVFVLFLTKIVRFLAAFKPPSFLS
jgi:hypothetical protein